MIKLVLGNNNKIIKLKPQTFEQLNQQITLNFPQTPPDYCLSYLDAEKDEICLTSEEDLQIMLAGGLKVTKVFIKQSITQTLVIDPDFTEQISVDFDDSREHPSKVEEPVLVAEKERTERVLSDIKMVKKEPKEKEDNISEEVPTDVKA